VTDDDGRFPIWQAGQVAVISRIDWHLAELAIAKNIQAGMPPEDVIRPGGIVPQQADQPIRGQQEGRTGARFALDRGQVGAIGRILKPALNVFAAVTLRLTVERERNESPTHRTGQPDDCEKSFFPPG
jgi:hypothetical protein